jgi:hypothetical protein
MELDHISKDTESMTTLILQINQILDTISGAFNSLENDTSTNILGGTEEALLYGIGERVVGKNFRFGTSIESTMKNNSLFVDKADLKLKFKDKSGIVTILA